MNQVFIIGTGMTPFGKFPNRSLVSLGAEAARRAMVDSGLEPGRIEAGFFSNALAGRLFGDSTVGQNVLWEVGLHQLPVVNVENACTSGSTALYLAHNAVAAGQAAAAIVVGAEKMCVPELGLIHSGATELETLLGLVAPASFALRAARHMDAYGSTPEQLAAVAVKNRQHAALNPCAQFRTPLTLEAVLNSPMIVDPLTRLQCCPNADGAAAVVLAGPVLAKRAQRAVEVAAAILCTGGYDNPPDLLRWETDYRGCAAAYEKAGIGPEDLDVVECHDAFTIAELLHYEAMGLCEPGEGGRFVESGASSLGGRIPVNVSGGLLSRGHPPGATGVAQVVEIALQLRDQAGARQVAGARVGFAQCMGGDKAGDTKSFTAIVLKA